MISSPNPAFRNDAQRFLPRWNRANTKPELNRVAWLLIAAFLSVNAAALGQELRQFTRHTYSVLSVAFSPDGQYLATGSADNTARLWEIIGLE
jgi:WD40 repeat protein